MSDSPLSHAFATLDEDLRHARVPDPVAPMIARAHARRRRHLAMTGTAVAACVALTGAAATTSGWLSPDHDKGAAVVAGAQPAVVDTPTAVPCTDQTLYSTSRSDPSAELTTRSPALDPTLLTPADLGWAAAKSTAADSAQGWRGTPSAADYRAATWSDAMSEPNAAGDSWELGQTVARMGSATAATTAYDTAVGLLTCTTPAHKVEVLGAGTTGDGTWVAVKETTTESDDGGTQTRWTVFARAGDLVTEVGMLSWGAEVAMTDKPVPLAWAERLGEATAARLAGTPAPTPVGAL